MRQACTSDPTGLVIANLIRDKVDRLVDPENRNKELEDAERESQKAKEYRVAELLTLIRSA